MHRPFRSATLLAGWLFLASGALPAAGATDPSPAAGRAGYAMGDFARVRKIDAHVHANTMQSAFLRQARADGFELVSINVDYPDFPAIDIQRRTAEALARRDPARSCVGSATAGRTACSGRRGRSSWSPTTVRPG